MIDEGARDLAATMPVGDDAGRGRAAASEDLQALLRISQSLVSELDLDEVLARVVEGAGALAGADRAAVWLLDDQGSHLRVARSTGQAIPKDLTLPVGAGIAGAAVRSGQPQLVDDLLADPRNPFPAVHRGLGLASCVALPIRLRDDVLGVLAVYGTSRAAFDEGQVPLLRLMADQAAIAINNARLLGRERAARARAEASERDLERRVAARTAEIERILADLNQQAREREQAQREVVKLTRRLSARASELAAANHDLESFTYSVSHDLRAPVRAINGFARMLLERYEAQMPPEAAGHLRTIAESARQMGALIDDLLHLSRIGRQPIATQPVDPTAVVREALVDLGVDPADSSLEIVVDDLPICAADPRLLRQVFVNLIGNAIKYSRGRSPARIHIGFEESEGRPAYFVRDNGIGFDMRYADKLFGVFQRLHAAEEFEGTGVGLAIVHRVVTRHGGRVWAHGEPDRGATFWFWLPPERANA